MVAIIPAAGRGTRMLSVTGGAPKELLEVGGKPLLSWVIEEALAVASRVVLVSSPAKPELSQFASDQVEIVIQEEPLGMGPAVMIPEIRDDVLILNPDTIFFPASPVADLVRAIEGSADICLAVEEVPPELVSRYGMVECHGGRIRSVLEKPQPGTTSSRLAIAGRFALSAEAYQSCRTWMESTKQPDVSLTPAIADAIGLGAIGLVRVLRPDEQRLDCGDPEGYRRALEVVKHEV